VLESTDARRKECPTAHCSSPKTPYYCPSQVKTREGLVAIGFQLHNGVFHSNVLNPNVFSEEQLGRSTVEDFWRVKVPGGAQDGTVGETYWP
jgi:hypothetical protein